MFGHDGTKRFIQDMLWSSLYPAYCYYSKGGMDFSPYFLNTCQATTMRPGRSSKLYFPESNLCRFMHKLDSAGGICLMIIFFVKIIIMSDKIGVYSCTSRHILFWRHVLHNKGIYGRSIEQARLCTMSCKHLVFHALPRWRGGHHRCHKDPFRGCSSSIASTGSEQRLTSILHQLWREPGLLRLTLDDIGHRRPQPLITAI
jgi:hypothetical protein